MTAKKFDAEKFVNEYLEDYHTPLTPGTYKGKRLPQWLIKVPLYSPYLVILPVYNTFFTRSSRYSYTLLTLSSLPYLTPATVAHRGTAILTLPCHPSRI